MPVSIPRLVMVLSAAAVLSASMRPERDAVRNATALRTTLEIAAAAPLGDLDGNRVSDHAVGLPTLGTGGAILLSFLEVGGGYRRSSTITAAEAGLGPGAGLGAGLAFLGDLDGDGLPELAASAPGADAVVRLTLGPRGELVRARSIDAPEGLAVGAALAAAGDLDGDGVADLVLADRRGDAIWILTLSRSGTVRDARRIADPGSAGFGASLASAGDLDGDGRAELAVGVPSADRVSLLFLDDQGLVRRHARIAPDVQGKRFGAAVAPLGDFDGDGTPDLVVGAPAADEVWALLLRRDGSVRAQLAIGRGTDALARDRATRRGLGSALALLGDLDGDARPELLATAGAPATSTGPFEGALWTLHLDTCFGPSVTQRRGYGVNPLELGADDAPRAGASWRLRLDCGNTGPGFAALTLRSAPAAGRVTRAGELLVDFSPATHLSTLVKPHGGGELVFEVRIPPEIAGACNLTLYAQGACGKPGTVRLSNAVDAVVGR